MGVSTLRFDRQHPLMSLALCSVPNGLAYEKFHIPDPVRIMDALVESLSY